MTYVYDVTGKEGCWAWSSEPEPEIMRHKLDMISIDQYDISSSHLQIV